MIGLCCQYIVSKTKKNGTVVFENSMEERTLQFGQYNKGKYTEQQIQETWVHNVSKFYQVLQRVNADGFKSVRISSNLFPLHDSVNSLLLNNEQVINLLNQAGNYAKNNNIRITCHPDQFVVLSSNNDAVIDTAIRMLQHHAWILDNMKLDQTPYYSINIHGGVRGNSKKLIEQTNLLPENIKNRLTFENDEKCYSVNDLFEVYKETNVPITFDSHHHSFNDCGISGQEAIDIAISTWGKYKPNTHLSNTDPIHINGSFTERRKHSERVHYIPEYQLKYNNEDKIDIDFEFKLKNIAIKEAVEKFKINL